MGRPILGALLLIAMVTWGHVVDGDRRGIDGFFELGFWPTGLTLVISLWVSTMLISGCGFRTPREQLAALLAGRRHDLTELRAALRLTIAAGPISGVLGLLLLTAQAMRHLSDRLMFADVLAPGFTYLLYGLAGGLLAYGLEALARRRVLAVSPAAEAPAGAGSEDPVDSPASHDPGPPSGARPDSGWGSRVGTALGLVLLVSTVLAVYRLDGGAMGDLLSPVSAGLIVGASMAAVLIGCGLSAPFGQLVALGRGEGRDLTALRRALGLVRVVAPLSGLLGMVMGFIVMFRNLSDPTRLGAGVAVALASLIWGLVVGLGAHGLQVAAARHGLRDPLSGEGGSDAVAGLPVLGGTLLLFVVLSSALAMGLPLTHVTSASAGLLVIGLVLAALVVCCEPVSACRQMARLLLGRALDDDAALRQTLTVASWAAPVAGAAGLVLGSMQLLYYFQDPTKLGSGVALGLLALLYAGALTLVSHALSTLTQTRGGDALAQDPAPSHGAWVAITGGVGTLMLFFAVLSALSQLK